MELKYGKNHIKDVERRVFAASFNCAAPSLSGIVEILRSFSALPPLSPAPPHYCLSVRHLPSIVDVSRGSTLLRWRIVAAMLLSETCLSAHSSHPLIHKISNI